MTSAARGTTRRTRITEAAIALGAAILLLVAALAYTRHAEQRDNDKAFATTLRKVKAASTPLRGDGWDRVRTASLRGGPGGVIDAFKDAGRPNHVTYERAAMIVELPTGAEEARSCVVASLRRDSASFATAPCTPSKD
jgi:hypothetical protein